MRKPFGVSRRTVKVGDADHLLLQADTVPIVGVLESPSPEIRPNWLPFVRVADVSAVVAKAAESGGRVILAPRPDIRDGTVAIGRAASLLAIGLLVLALACGGHMSVGVGFAVPAPWGSVSIGTSVPIGYGW
jgi:hypothetical protein